MYTIQERWSLSCMMMFKLINYKQSRKENLWIILALSTYLWISIIIINHTWIVYPNTTVYIWIKMSMVKPVTYTIKPRLEAHMDMILFEVFLKSIGLIPQQQILVQRYYLYYRQCHYLILWNQVDILQKHFKNYHVHMCLWTRFYGRLHFLKH